MFQRYYFWQLLIRFVYVFTFRLVSKRQMDASIGHFIEAGATIKALEAAVGAKQWRKALQVLPTFK